MAVTTEHFASARSVSRGVLHDCLSLPGLVAERAGDRVGLLLYRIQRDECEVVVLLAARRRQGIGRSLLEAVKSGSIREARRLKRFVTTKTQRRQGRLGFLGVLESWW